MTVSIPTSTSWCVMVCFLIVLVILCSSCSVGAASLPTACSTLPYNWSVSVDLFPLADALSCVRGIGVTDSETRYVLTAAQRAVALDALHPFLSATQRSTLMSVTQRDPNSYKGDAWKLHRDMVSVFMTPRDPHFTHLPPTMFQGGLTYPIDFSSRIDRLANGTEVQRLVIDNVFSLRGSDKSRQLYTAAGGNLSPGTVKTVNGMDAMQWARRRSRVVGTADDSVNFNAALLRNMGAPIVRLDDTDLTATDLFVFEDRYGRVITAAVPKFVALPNPRFYRIDRQPTGVASVPVVSVDVSDKRTTRSEHCGGTRLVKVGAGDAYEVIQTSSSGAGDVTAACRVGGADTYPMFDFVPMKAPREFHSQRHSTGVSPTQKGEEQEGDGETKPKTGSTENKRQSSSTAGKNQSSSDSSRKGFFRVDSADTWELYQAGDYRSMYLVAPSFLPQTSTGGSLGAFIGEIFNLCQQAHLLGKAEGYKRLVVDLRGNTGGLLALVTALEMCVFPSSRKGYEPQFKNGGTGVQDITSVEGMRPENTIHMKGFVNDAIMQLGQKRYYNDVFDHVFNTTDGRPLPDGWWYDAIAATNRYSTDFFTFIVTGSSLFSEGFEEVFVVTNGFCGSACSIFSSRAQKYHGAIVVSLGGLLNEPMIPSVFGGASVRRTSQFYRLAELTLPEYNADFTYPAAQIYLSPDSAVPLQFDPELHASFNTIRFYDMFEVEPEELLNRIDAAAPANAASGFGGGACGDWMLLTSALAVVVLALSGC